MLWLDQLLEAARRLETAEAAEAAETAGLLAKHRDHAPPRENHRLERVALRILPRGQQLWNS